EPASVLLERIRAEKQKLIKEGKIKKDKKSSEIFRGASRNLPYTFCEQVGKEIRDISDEIPFEIPDSWEWVRLASIIELQSGQDLTPDKYNANEKGLPYITGASNIENGNVIINRWTEHGRAFAFKGDILLTCKGTVGTMAILQQEQVHIARQIMGIRPYKGTDTDYVKLVLETLVERLKAAAKSMIPGIARDDVLFSLMPLPPLSEQHRIVAKIEELLPYIEKYDKAETQLTKLNATFPEALKKSILQEAVQGKLVPQNPDDEPASVLLERIRVEKQKLIKEGKIRKDKHESQIIISDKIPYEIVDGEKRCIADEVPFELPDSWCWCRFGTAMVNRDAERIPLS
ncbi:MAG: restriction endonuclease subunit S, partial [Oscillospiraceae bacterium]